LKKINDLFENPKIKTVDIEKCRAGVMEGMNFMFEDTGKYNPKVWKQIIRNLNNLNDRDPKFMDE